MTITTAIGPAHVLHRLALAVVCTDSVIDRPVSIPLRIGWERPERGLPRGFDRSWPCLDLDRHGPGRAVLRLDRRTPTGPVRIRIVDPRRRYAARRVELSLWKLTEIVAAEATPPEVPAVARTLRLWLLPGPAYVTARGATSVRGRVAVNGTPVRWARITAFGPGNQSVGRAHADERGEFLLLVTDTGTMPPPAPSTLGVRLEVIAPDPAHRPAVDAADRHADLVVETLTHPGNPPLPAELDNDVLRGRATPSGYLASTTAFPPVDLVIGQEKRLTTDIPFTA
jgi:hypothetical protein